MAGRPASVGSFCDALVSFFLQRSGSFGQSGRLYKQAEALVKQAKARPGAGVDAAAEAARLSCAARYGFDHDEGWAWNEYNIGQALLLLGQVERKPELLRLALLASSSAAGVFQASNEGWGWSRYAAGQSAHSLWRLEKSDPYLSKTLEVLREVVGNEAMPAEVLGYAKLELGDALMDSYERTGRKEALDEARRQLQGLDQQEEFKEDSRGAFERLRAMSPPD